MTKCIVYPAMACCCVLGSQLPQFFRSWMQLIVQTQRMPCPMPRYNLTKYSYKSWWSWFISSLVRRTVLGDES